MIRHFYLSPEIDSVTIKWGGVVCSSPGEISNFTYERVTEDDGFTVVE